MILIIFIFLFYTFFLIIYPKKELKDFIFRILYMLRIFWCVSWVNLFKKYQQFTFDILSVFIHHGTKNDLYKWYYEYMMPFYKLCNFFKLLRYLKICCFKDFWNPYFYRIFINIRFISIYNGCVFLLDHSTKRINVGNFSRKRSTYGENAYLIVYSQ